MLKLIHRLPDNWHAHLREQELLLAVYHHFNIYGRVLCMGNLMTLIETAFAARHYREDILELPVRFQPEICIMLTQDTTRETIYEAAEAGIKFVKFLPVGTSTGAIKGLRLDDFAELYLLFPVIEETVMHLLIHSELMSERDGTEIPLIEREERAIIIAGIFHRRFPGLKITIEHASTAKMIDFVKWTDSPNVRATLTPQHGILTYDDVFHGRDWPPHNPLNYCLPVAKLESDKRSVVKATVSGDERFFYGTDAAPHWIVDKTGHKPKAGVFFGANEYVRSLEIFEREGAIDKFEDFTSRFGAEYYGYPLNQETLTVVQEVWQPRDSAARYPLLSGRSAAPLEDHRKER